MYGVYVTAETVFNENGPQFEFAQANYSLNILELLQTRT